MRYQYQLLLLLSLILCIIIINNIISQTPLNVNNLTIIDITHHNIDEIEIAIESFASSLFCDITKSPSDTIKYKPILKEIYNLQFNHSCDLNRKYYIFSNQDFNTNRGFMSFIDHQYTPPFILSIYTNRTFIFTKNPDENPWIYLPNNGKNITQLCQNQTGRNCIFKPISNCTEQNILDIINHAKQNNKFAVIDRQNPRIKPQICRKSKYFTPSSFHNLTQKYTVIYQKSKCNMFWNRGQTMNRGLVELIIKNREYKNINYFQFSALIWSVIMRLQENIKLIINEIVNQSLVKYKWKSMENTISIPIRASINVRIMILLKVQKLVLCTIMDQK